MVREICISQGWFVLLLREHYYGSMNNDQADHLKKCHKFLLSAKEELRTAALEEPWASELLWNLTCDSLRVQSLVARWSREQSHRLSSFVRQLPGVLE
jgi:hypothetical protein